MITQYSRSHGPDDRPACDLLRFSNRGAQSGQFALMLARRARGRGRGDESRAKVREIYRLSQYH
jgi:hypothetical protein